MPTLSVAACQIDPQLGDVEGNLDRIGRAVAEAAAAGVRGPALTPHVLAAVHTATAGRSLEANRRLIVDNAGLAAEIAVSYYA